MVVAVVSQSHASINWQRAYPGLRIIETRVFLWQSALLGWVEVYSGRGLYGSGLW